MSSSWEEFLRDINALLGPPASDESGGLLHQNTLSSWCTKTYTYPNLHPALISVGIFFRSLAIPYPFFIGQRCTVDVDECVSKPCMNNGICHNTQGSYMCECPPGFSGMDCEEDINDCLASEYTCPGAQGERTQSQ